METNRSSKRGSDILPILTLILLAIFCSRLAPIGNPQGIVDDVASITESLEPHPWKCDRAGFEFDVNQYFAVLDHLSMEPGYTLDYVLLCDPAGRKPFVYARPIEQTPYTTSIELWEATGSDEHLPWSYEDSPQSDDYLAHIQIDDTKEGYFQFVVLWTMEDQFYLGWHGLYHDKIVVGSQKGAEDALSSCPMQTESYTDTLRSIQTINYNPVIEFAGDEVTVRFVTFTKWGGFTEVITKVERRFPHNIVDVQEKTLAEHWCGPVY